MKSVESQEAAKSSEPRPRTGSLFVVATPIGNLGDITLRAIETLKSVDLILAEDTRRTGQLLQHLMITKPMRSFFEHSSQKEVSRTLDLLKNGQDVALVSDAGTPLISDPGLPLLEACTEVGIRVVPIPGATAVTALLSVAGVVAVPFRFVGFLPTQKSELRRVFEEFLASNETQVCFEAPHRLVATLSLAAEILGPLQNIVIGRELTKLHEEVRRESVASALRHFEKSPVLGELVLAFPPAKDAVKERADSANPSPQDPSDLDVLITSLAQRHVSLRDAVANLRELTRLSKNEAYRLVLPKWKSLHPDQDE